MPPLVDGVLLAALLGTCACVVPMYLKLKRLDRIQAEYGRAFAESGHALASAGEAVRRFSGEGRDTLAALSLGIEEARAVLAELDAGRRAILAPGVAPGARTRGRDPSDVRRESESGR